MINDLSSFISPFKNYPTVILKHKIMPVIDKVRSSHEPIFVYDDLDLFKGIVWPYYLLFRKKPTRNSNVGSYVFQPPRLNINNNIYQVIKHMVGLRLYNLPVFNEKEIIGMVTARKILEVVIKNDNYFEQVSLNLRYQNAVTMPDCASIKRVYSSMRKNKISRIVLVNHNNQLSGIITRRDIYLALLKPTDKQRYSVNRNGNKSLVFDEEWITKLDYPLRKLQRKETIHINENNNMRNILSEMFQRQSNYIVLVNNNKQPTYILTIRLILEAVLKTEPAMSPPIIFTDKKKLISAFRKREIDDLVLKTAKKIDKGNGIKNIEILFDSIKNPKSKVSLYKIALHFRFQNGKVLQSKTKSYNLRIAVQKSISKIERQLNK